MKPNKNINAVAFYDSVAKKKKNIWYAYNREYPLLCELDVLVPFQLTRDHLAATPITVFKIIRNEDLVEHDILALAAGQLYISYDHNDVEEVYNYDLIAFQALAALLIPSVKIGSHYYEISDGTNTWYSDDFTMCADVDNLLRINYHHLENFCYPNGHIEYTYPFTGRLYFSTDLGKSEPKFINRYSINQSIEFPIERISYIVYNFTVFVPEYVVHVLRALVMHHKINVKMNGEYYEVTNMTHDDPEYTVDGDMAEVVLRFRTKTTIVVTGTGLLTDAYGDEGIGEDAIDEGDIG